MENFTDMNLAKMVLEIYANTKPMFFLELTKISGLEEELGGRILMGELEHFFSKYPNGFYVNNELFSFERGLDKNFWKEDFELIGTRYSSQEEFQAEKDKFKGKFYCSYYDKKRNETCYLRNHLLVEETIKSILGDRTVADIYNEHIEQHEANVDAFLRRIEAGEFDNVDE